MPAIRQSILSVVLLLLAAGLAACQTAPPMPPVGAVSPVETVVPNLRVTLAHGACSGPPCPVGVVESLDSGERVTIYDYDLMPLGLPAVDRMRMTQAMFASEHLVRGEVERRIGFLGLDRPVEVLVIDAIAGPA